MINEHIAKLARTSLANSGSERKKQKTSMEYQNSSFDGTFIEVVEPDQSSSSNGCRKSARKRTIRHFWSC